MVGSTGAIRGSSYAIGAYALFEPFLPLPMIYATPLADDTNSRPPVVHVTTPPSTHSFSVPLSPPTRPTELTNAGTT